MNFDYSAFDIEQIIDVMQKNKVDLSFEKLEDLQQTFEEILPILLNAKARSKKYFNPYVRVLNYDYETEELNLICNYNTYADSGVMFDDNNRNHLTNINQFLRSYTLLNESYFFDSLNVFGTSIDAKQESIIYHEYGINYIPLKIFHLEELRKFVGYMPCLQKIDIEKIQSCNLTLTNFVVNTDGTPKKLEFAINKKNIFELQIFDEYESNEEICNIIANPSCDDACKIGFYFTGKEQNKISLLFNLIDSNILEKKFNDDAENILYEITWQDKNVLQRTISYLETF